MHQLWAASQLRAGHRLRVVRLRAELLRAELLRAVRPRVVRLLAVWPWAELPRVAPRLRAEAELPRAEPRAAPVPLARRPLAESPA